MILGGLNSFALLALVSLRFSSSFVPRSYSRHAMVRQSATKQLMASNYNDLLDSQRQDCQEFLGRVDSLQNELQLWNTTEDLAFDLKLQSVEILETEYKQIMSQLLPPAGLSIDAYVASIRIFLKLPPQARLAFVKALGMEDEAAGDVQKIPEIVSKMYEERYALTPQRISDSLKSAKVARSSTIEGAGEASNKNEDAEAVVAKFFEKGPDETRVEQSVNQLLPRVTRKEDMMATAKDLEVLTNSLDNSIFAMNGRPIDIPGGFVIRGQNRKASGMELIEALDAKLPSNWDCTVSYMEDISAVEAESMIEGIGNALVLLKKDFSPVTNEWFYRFTSASALVTISLFCVGVYGGNTAVLDQLADSTALGDFGGLEFFNGKVAEVVLPLVFILASHEFGHFLVAQNRKIETSSFLPTLLPFWSNLPVLGSLTRITSSPKNLTALFDFAFMGPLLGFVSSTIFLGTGLLLTQSALEGDANAAQFLPALPVSVLKLSTLGGSIVDNFFGGSGFITSQDPTTAVPLHPYAIAGYCGLLINAVEMLPLGANDGARLSMTLFGRTGQSFIGGFAWFALLIASFTLEDQQSELLITAWIINNIVQNDMEVPCRDETDKVSLPRFLAASAMWFFAALTVIPMV